MTEANPIMTIQRTGYIDRGSKQEGETCGDDAHGHHKEADEQLLKIIQ